MKKSFFPAALLTVLTWQATFAETNRVPVELFPTRTFAVIRVANLTELDRKYQETGLPSFFAMMAAQGQLPANLGLDFERPWYAVWAEDSPKKEMPYAVVPLADLEAFRKHPMVGDPASKPRYRIRGDHAIMGVVPVPEIGGSTLAGEFTGDIEGMADLNAVRSVFSGEIAAFRTALQTSLVQDLTPQPPDGSKPQENREEIADLLQSQIAMFFEFLDQSELLAIRLNLADGNLGCAVRWSLDPESPWGKLVGSQKPKSPAGLERVVEDASMVSWASFDLSKNSEVVEPFYRRAGALMQGMDPEILLELMKQRGEMVVGGTALQEGLEFETIYSLQGSRRREFQDDFRTLMRMAAEETSGVTTEYRPRIGKVKGMEVDRLVQKFSGTGTEELPLGMERMEAYYGWGKKEILSLVRFGSEKTDWVDRLLNLASGSKHPLPESIRKELDDFPAKLLLFAWVDLGGLLGGLGDLDPGSGMTEWSGRLPPFASYVSSQGSRLEFGGSLDLKAVFSAATSLLTPDPDSGGEGDEP
ncbi:MAG: hypothetical protein V3T54_07645 [Acidobacteriota bacterium]